MLATYTRDVNDFEKVDRRTLVEERKQRAEQRKRKRGRSEEKKKGEENELNGRVEGNERKGERYAVCRF